MQERADVLRVEDREGVRLLVLNRPERLNALDDALVGALHGALHTASGDDGVRVVVVTGAGTAFCAGLDLQAQMAKGIQFDPDDDLGWVGRQALGVVGCQKPVIAALNGPAVGAGLGLALAADLRYLAEGSYVAAGYVRRALSPDAGVSYFLPRLIPPTHAMEILLTGRRVPAEECQRLGLVNALFPAETLLAGAMAVATRIAAGPGLALRLTKGLVHRSLDQDLPTHLRDEWATIQRVATSEEVAEALVAFLEKREPRWGNTTGTKSPRGDRQTDSQG